MFRVIVLLDQQAAQSPPAWLEKAGEFPFVSRGSLQRQFRIFRRQLFPPESRFLLLLNQRLANLGQLVQPLLKLDCLRLFRIQQRQQILLDERFQCSRPLNRLGERRDGIPILTRQLAALKTFAYLLK